jgi:hypothetical protein
MLSGRPMEIDSLPKFITRKHDGVQSIDFPRQIVHYLFNQAQALIQVRFESMFSDLYRY